MLGMASTYPPKVEDQVRFLAKILRLCSGCGPARSGRVPWKHENAGSNPAIPTGWNCPVRLTVGRLSLEQIIPVRLRYRVLSGRLTGRILRSERRDVGPNPTLRT